MPTPNPHLEDWMETWMEERYKSGMLRPSADLEAWMEARAALGTPPCKNADEAIRIWDYLQGEVTQFFQQGAYCSKAPVGHHPVTRSVRTSMEAGQHLAKKAKRDAEQSKPAPKEGISGPYWENDAHRFSALD